MPTKAPVAKEVKRPRSCSQSFPVAFGDATEGLMVGIASRDDWKDLLCLLLSLYLSPLPLLHPFLVRLSLRNLGGSFDHFTLSLWPLSPDWLKDLGGGGNL